MTKEVDPWIVAFIAAKWVHRIGIPISLYLAGMNHLQLESVVWLTLALLLWGFRTMLRRILRLAENISTGESRSPSDS